jgi:F-type H+-transporting ATPase subunit b
MPQISQIIDTYASQFFWLLIVFGLIYFTIGRGMLPKIEANMDARDRKIADDLAAAERARAEADSLEDGGSVAINEARAAAQAKATEAKAKAAKDAEARLAVADAEADLAKASAKAMTSIESVAAEAAADIVAKVSGAKVSAAQAATAVKAVLANG